MMENPYRVAREQSVVKRRRTSWWFRLSRWCRENGATVKVEGDGMCLYFPGCSRGVQVLWAHASAWNWWFQDQPDDEPAILHTVSGPEGSERRGSVCVPATYVRKLQRDVVIMMAANDRSWKPTAKLAAVPQPKEPSA